MKKVLLSSATALLVATSLSSASAQTQTVRFKDKNGSGVAEVTVVNGKAKNPFTGETIEVGSPSNTNEQTTDAQFEAGLKAGAVDGGKSKFIVDEASQKAALLSEFNLLTAKNVGGPDPVASSKNDKVKDNKAGNATTGAGNSATSGKNDKKSDVQKEVEKTKAQGGASQGGKALPKTSVAK